MSRQGGVLAARFLRWRWESEAASGSRRPGVQVWLRRCRRFTFPARFRAKMRRVRRMRQRLRLVACAPLRTGWTKSKGWNGAGREARRRVGPVRHQTLRTRDASRKTLWSPARLEASSLSASAENPLPSAPESRPQPEPTHGFGVRNRRSTCCLGGKQTSLRGSRLRHPAESHRQRRIV
jgi:hypothetical protein